MPHSTQQSVDSDRTFDLSKPDRPSSRSSDRTARNSHSRRSSGLYGVALSSEAVTEERIAEPAQTFVVQQTHKERVDINKMRRRSTPGTAEDYANVVVKTEDVELLIPGQRAAELDNMRNALYNDASKRRAMYYEEHVQVKPKPVKKTKERVQLLSPVIAELKTNVIVSCECLRRLSGQI